MTREEGEEGELEGEEGRGLLVRAEVGLILKPGAGVEPVTQGGENEGQPSVRSSFISLSVLEWG